MGIITNATLKLHARPESQSAAMASFSTTKNAIKTVVEILQNAIPIARIEFLDQLSMKICNAYSKTNYVEEPTLFMEFHGSPLAIDEQIKIVTEITDSNHGSKLTYATTEEDRNQLWKARHDMHWAIHDYKPMFKYHGTDICVPISQLPKSIEFCQNYFAALGVSAPIMGHVGDGNLHCNIYFDPDIHPNDPIQFDHVRAAEKLALHAIGLGGTCTGEHGIGLGKKNLLQKQFGPSGIKTMSMIKNALDPLNIMNPGKIL